MTELSSSVIFFMPHIVVEKLEHSHAHDDKVTHKAPYVGDVSEKEKADSGGENQLRIIVDRDLSRGCVGVGSRYRELAACRRHSGANTEKNATISGPFTLCLPI